MKHSLTSFALCLALWGCSEPAISETQNPTPVSVKTTDKHPYEDVEFEDVLKQHQALNTRLDAVTYKLRAHNGDLCPQTTRSLGLTVHTVEDYPEEIQDLARATLSVSDKVSIRTVWPGSPAEAAGLEPGDVITRFGGYGLPSGPTAIKLYKAIAAQGLNGSSVDLTIDRNGTARNVTVQPETLCGYPSRILWMDQINAFTNGETILITSELIRRTPDDNDLAMFVAHELAHAVAEHIDLEPSRALELEADRMGLFLMARAGFDVDAAVESWPNMPHPHLEDSENVSSHPGLEKRLDNLESALSEIKQVKAEGRELRLD